ncbi:Heavy-metal-associated domain (N-terminus) and membrane-bounded cytochrome biogenesis cycZ-like domain, possible membrane copper tolerance protein [hydrothermal vent metagenome]|uniref:Heavy-metal-associated domain (N-terminus) and membrane-bounded cytochrome biogenesis cycZ-like domain, possible membrane copper tolerance protein n=1 Tax=hydrothermal vent metagenome TaxID=652676 RepID=A0A3B0XWS7_9ZZZZ
MHDFTFITAFIVGLMGGVHCVGMCGGIVGALSFAAQGQPDSSKPALFGLLLAYNFGRIFSYALAGGLMGSLGWLLSVWSDIRFMQLLLQLIAGLFMLLMGLYISGWWMGLVKLERAGAYVWKYIKPVAHKVLPIKSPVQAALLGLLWGWLPCGLVYSVLVWSVSAGSFQQGALLMLGFGLGTLPNLLAMGLFAGQLKTFVQYRAVRTLAGGVVMAFAFWHLFTALKLLGGG